LIVPAAAKWLADDGHVVSLLNPHYERAKLKGVKRCAGPMPPAEAEAIRDRIAEELTGMGFPPVAMIESPLRGKGGNLEFLMHMGIGSRR